jgi:hypothetical protein
MKRADLHRGTVYAYRSYGTVGDRAPVTPMCILTEPDDSRLFRHSNRMTRVVGPYWKSSYASRPRVSPDAPVGYPIVMLDTGQPVTPFALRALAEFTLADFQAMTSAWIRLDVPRKDTTMEVRVRTGLLVRVSLVSSTYADFQAWQDAERAERERAAAERKRLAETAGERGDELVRRLEQLGVCTRFTLSEDGTSFRLSMPEVEAVALLEKLRQS